MNFRGSTGYGRKFWEASFGQWGLKHAGRHHRRGGSGWSTQGVADPKRLAIYGASYGGYATLAGVAFTPDLYAAAINYVGVSNLFTFMKTIPPYWEPWREHDARNGRCNPDNETGLGPHGRLTSPVFHMSTSIRTCPLFIAQGAQRPACQQGRERSGGGGAEKTWR
jgi:dipeptidyl aminopeptidase/acylaminoacyl peptidase